MPGSYAVVGQVVCPCATAQPDPATFAIDAVWGCSLCGQLWRRATKRSSNRGGGGIMIHHVLVGGMARAHDVPVWVRQGRNVSRDAATALARAELERQYVADASALRAAVASGEVPAGVGVRRYRAHRDALAHPVVRLFSGTVGVLAVLAVLGLAGLVLAGVATGAWPGVAILAGVWLVIVGKALRVGVARRREVSSAIISAPAP